MPKHSKAYVGHGLSRFLIAYLALLLGVLMLVHALQPDRGSSVRSLRTPEHRAVEERSRQATTAGAAAFGLEAIARPNFPLDLEAAARREVAAAPATIAVGGPAAAA